MKQKVSKEELLVEKKRLAPLSSFLDSPAGKALTNTLLKRIKLGVKQLLDVATQDSPDLGRAFATRSAQLKTHLLHYQDLNKVKSSLDIVMLALEEFGPDVEE